MFEILKPYNVTMLEETGDHELAEATYFGLTVVEVNLPLVKFSGDERTMMIVNTSSPRFVRATESE